MTGSFAAVLPELIKLGTYNRRWSFCFGSHTNLLVRVLDVFHLPHSLCVAMYCSYRCRGFRGCRQSFHGGDPHRNWQDYHNEYVDMSLVYNFDPLSSVGWIGIATLYWVWHRPLPCLVFRFSLTHPYLRTYERMCFHPVCSFGRSSIGNFLVTDNRLSTTIPTEIGLLAGVFKLRLGGAQVFGTIPTEIGQVTRLRECSKPRTLLEKKHRHLLSSSLLP